jgi:hypothetical protein
MATAIDINIDEKQREKLIPMGKPPPKTIEPAMLPDEFTPGTIMIKAETPLPGSMNVLFKQYRDWRVPRGLNAFGFERRLAANGWHYFFILPSARPTRWAFRPEKAIRRALDAALRRVEYEGFNSMEIADVEIKKVFGVYRVKLTTHARHVKNSPFLREPDPYARMPRIWDFRRIFDKINRDNPQLKAM